MAPENDTGELSSFITGIIMGFLASVPVAAWLSPRSGEEARRSIRQRGVMIRRKAEQTVRKPLEQVERLRGESLDDAIAEGKAIAAQKRE